MWAIVLTLTDAVFAEDDSVWMDYAKQHAMALSKREIEIIPHKNNDLGATGIALVKAPVSMTWQVITDYPEYSQFMPRNLYSEILRRQQNTVVFKTRYESAFPFDPVENESRIVHETRNPNALKMSWVAEKTNLEFNRGFWLLITHPEFSPAVLVVYQTRFAIPWVPSALAASASQKTLKATLEAVRKRAEAQMPRYQSPTIRFAWEDTPYPAVTTPR